MLHWVILRLIIQAYHPYVMDFFEFFTNGRHHRDMKILKILASNSKQFQFYGIFLKWQIEAGCTPANILNTTFS